VGAEKDGLAVKRPLGVTRLSSLRTGTGPNVFSSEPLCQLKTSGPFHSLPICHALGSRAHAQAASHQKVGPSHLPNPETIPARAKIWHIS
jgi:hypothetical protein